MKVSEIRKKVDQVVSITLIIILALMVLNVSYQVFTRYFTDTPSSFTDELSRYLMIWLGILGAAYIAGRNQHVSIDILVNKFSPKWKTIVWHFTNWSIILLAVFGLIIGGGHLVYITLILNQNSPTLSIPLGVVYLIIPLSGLLVVFYKVTQKKPI